MAGGVSFSRGPSFVLLGKWPHGLSPQLGPLFQPLRTTWPSVTTALRTTPNMKTHVGLTIRCARRLHRTYGLLSMNRINYRNVGSWCCPRVVPVLWHDKRCFEKCPKTLLQTPIITLKLKPNPRPHVSTESRKNQAFFVFVFLEKKWGRPH